MQTSQKTVKVKNLWIYDGKAKGTKDQLTKLTATATELNSLSGATIVWADITATAAEVNLLDGATVVVSDITATAAEVNVLDGATAVNDTTGLAAILTLDGALSIDGDLATTSKVGAPSDNVFASEGGHGARHVTRLSMVNTVIPAIPGADAEAVGVEIYTFPATGDIVIHGAGLVAGITGHGDVAADEPDVGLGSAIGTGDFATLDGVANSEDIMTGQTWSTGKMAGTEQIGHVFQELVLTKGANKIYFNVADTWAAASPTNTVTGLVWIEWSIRTYPLV